MFNTFPSLLLFLFFKCYILNKLLFKFFFIFYFKNNRTQWNIVFIVRQLVWNTACTAARSSGEIALLHTFFFLISFFFNSHSWSVKNKTEELFLGNCMFYCVNHLQSDATIHRENTQGIIQCSRQLWPSTFDLSTKCNSLFPNVQKS